MDDTKAIEALYRDYWQAMIDGDTAALREMMTEDYALQHMTGARQSREAFLAGVSDGTFRYFRADHDDIQVEVCGDTAHMTGMSRVEAAVYGGRPSLWRLRGDFTLRREQGRWRLASSRASTY